MNDCTSQISDRRRGRGERSAFTLIELLVTISIIAVLLTISVSSLAGAIASARSVECQASLRDLAIDFQTFADPSFGESRGEDNRLTGGRFRLATFQDQQYGVDEFWRWGADRDLVTMPDPSGNDPMRCAEVSGDITFRRGIECVDGAVSPSQRISYGFNRRLHRAEVIDHRGRPRTVPVYLNRDILSEPGVPLAWDVDGHAAAERHAYPGFSAPALDSRGAYAEDRFWYPGARHNGSLNIVFMDTHVESTADPLAGGSWRWEYQPVN